MLLSFKQPVYKKPEIQKILVLTKKKVVLHKSTLVVAHSKIYNSILCSCYTKVLVDLQLPINIPVITFVEYSLLLFFFFFSSQALLQSTVQQQEAAIEKQYILAIEKQSHKCEELLNAQVWVWTCRSLHDYLLASALLCLKKYVFWIHQ